jgi:hypothetical protein
MTIDEYAEWAGTVAKVAAAPGNEKLPIWASGCQRSPVKSPTTSRSCCVMVISIRQR